MGIRQRIGRKSDAARESSRKVAGLVAAREHIRQRRLDDVAQTSVPGKPHARNRRQPERRALVIDRVLVEDHLNLDLPALPRLPIATSRKESGNRPAERGVERRRRKIERALGVREPRRGPRGRKGHAVFGEVIVEARDQRPGFVVAKIGDAAGQHDEIAIGDERDRRCRHDVFVADRKIGAERAERRKRRLARQAQRDARRCTEAARFERRRFRIAPERARRAKRREWRRVALEQAGNAERQHRSKAGGERARRMAGPRDSSMR